MTTAATMTTDPEFNRILNQRTQETTAPLSTCINTEPEELEKYLASLSPEDRVDVVKWSDVPDSELKKPSERQAAGLLKHFQQQHETVPAGQRNHVLFKYSCCLRRCGLSENAILESLWAFTDEHCKPPHNRNNSNDVAELKSLAERAFKYVKVGFPRRKNEDVPIDGTEGPLPIKALGALTEMGNSIAFVAEYRDQCKFSFDGKRWYVWDNEQRWKPNHIGKVKRWAKTIVRRLYGHAGNIEDDNLRDRILKHAERSNTRAGVNNLLDLASSELECSDLDFDQDGYLLNCQNCTIDLRTGAPHDHSQDDMCSKITGVDYNPDASCPIWEAHISKIFDNDKDLIKNFQEICGYILAGIGNPSAIFLVLYGRGRNGKTVCLNVLAHVMGDYAVSIAPQSLQPMKPGQIRSDLMPLKGARMITCTEPGKGMVLDDGVIKAATGGDQINARHLYGEPEQFRMSGSIFLATNNKPKVRDQSAGMWDRVWMIPFKHYFDPTSPDTDPDMEQKLMKEASGILNWCITGWKRYHETGRLIKCKPIQDETTEYQNSEDFLYDFLYQKNTDGVPTYKIEKSNKNLEIRASELYNAYKQWCTLSDINIKPMSSTSFGREMGSRFDKIRDDKGYKYLGITIAKTPIQTKVPGGV